MTHNYQRDAIKLSKKTGSTRIGLMFTVLETVVLPLDELPIYFPLDTFHNHVSYGLELGVILFEHDGFFSKCHYRQTLLRDLITDGNRNGEMNKNHYERSHHLAQRTLIVMKQVRIVRIELTTKDWKSPILPLNYIRKFCSGIALPLLRVERRVIAPTMT